MTYVEFLQIELEPSNDEFIDEYGYHGLMNALGQIATEQT